MSNDTVTAEMKVLIYPNLCTAYHCKSDYVDCFFYIFFIIKVCLWIILHDRWKIFWQIADCENELIGNYFPPFPAYYFQYLARITFRKCLALTHLHAFFHFAGSGSGNMNLLKVSSLYLCLCFVSHFSVRSVLTVNSQPSSLLSKLSFANTMGTT